MPTIYVDGKPCEFEGQDRNLLDVCLELGFDIPYYCWHPAMHSAGACRQCAVKLYRNEEDTEGRIVMACMTPASEGARLSIDDPEAVEFRAAVAEWLMLSHPHDCPVCDEGGECHLQDMTHLTGHVYRRTRFPKRTFDNQYLGPHINHEMNRCIHCYRCVRFCHDVAGERDLAAFGWHDHVYFGKHTDGELRSGLTGNLVEVCPTGCFTDKTFKKHYVRPWDLQTAPSICVHCGLGCNILPGERDGKLRRIRNRHNPEVNGHFICDRGRFGYEFVNSDRRVRKPMMRGADGTLEEASPEDVMARLEPLLREKRVLGIGSPRASLETNFALRHLVGAENFFDGTSAKHHELMSLMVEMLMLGPGRSASLRDVTESDAVVVLGEDVTTTAPMLAISLRNAVVQQAMSIAGTLQIHEFHDGLVREAIQQDTGPLFIASPDETGVDRSATVTYRQGPEDIARMGAAVAQRIHIDAPPADDVDDATGILAAWIADELTHAQRPLVICGYGSGSPEVIRAATNIVCALEAAGKNAGFVCTVPECNSMGVALMDTEGVEGVSHAIEAGDVGAIIVAENDLCRRMTKSELETFMPEGVELIVIDHLMTCTGEMADVVLPAATFAEHTGTLVNGEGRGQRSLQVFQPEGDVKPSWRWLSELAARRDDAGSATWRTFDEIVEQIAREFPALAGITDLAPDADFRMHGMKVPRQSIRRSGRTALHAAKSVHEPRPPQDEDAPMAFSSEGYRGEVASALVARQWAPGWNSPAALSKVTARRQAGEHVEAAGKRLLEPADHNKLCYYDPVPAFERRDDEWLAVPIYRIFGSEELSAHSPGLADLSAPPYVGMSPDDAERMQVEQGQEVGVAVGQDVYTLPVRVREQLPAGVLGITPGLPGLEDLQLPAWVKLLGSGMTPWMI